MPLRTFALLVLIAAATALRAQPYRTLTDRNGERMRGTPIALAKQDFAAGPVALAKDPASWVAIRERGLNTVRLCWVDPWFNMDGRSAPGWTMNELTDVLDRCVANATAAGLNVIINYHNVGEYTKTGGFGRMDEFWRTVAPRYRDNDLVFYELNNEQAFDGAAYRERKFRRATKRTYRRVRRAAPERQIILFSFNSLQHDMKAIVDSYRFIDWEYTSVGWHFYGQGKGGDAAQEQKNLLALLAAYRSICTEWDYPGLHEEYDYIKPFFDRPIMAENLERLGISWVDWRGWSDATLNEFDDLLIPDARRKGYAWWAD